jgi:hypothetical protein
MLRFITIQQGNTSDQNITLRKNHTMNQGIDFYNLSQSLAGAIFGAMIKYMERPSDSPPPLLQLRRGRAEAPAWFLVQALEFDPEPISVEKLRVRDIYASERIVFSLLELMASEKWLTPAGKGEFILAPAGRAAWQPAPRAGSGLRRRRRAHLIHRVRAWEKCTGVPGDA